MSKYKNDNVNFDLLGNSVNFCGDLEDKYFADLAAHSAQNGMLYELMKYFLKPGSIFLDVGANIGVTSRAARIICPQSKIYCLEPSPKACHYLSKNADPDWIILNCGAGSQGAVVDFHESDFLAGSSIWLSKDISNTERRIIKVPIKTLDSILAEYRVDNDPSLLIKIDIEGFELDALKGAKKIASKENVLFVAEFNSYAIAANGKNSPFVFLENISSLYGKFYGVRDGEWVCIEAENEMRDFFYQNMVTQGCVEDIFFGSAPAIEMILEAKSNNGK
jgi:FkbM family methyltransferase